MQPWFEKLASSGIVRRLRLLLSPLHSQRHHNRNRSGLSYGTCEPRRLLAGIEFNAESGQIFIGGTNDDDVVRVTETTNGIRVDQLVSEQREGYVFQSIFDSKTFNADEVESIFFVGLRGDDRFENYTSIDSFAFGQVGNDTLIGGSGNDRLVGNGDNDIIIGNEGNDVLIAGIGDDEVDAGSGNDRVLGVAGANRLEGGLGNDTIYGGQNRDVISDLGGNNLLVGSNGNDSIKGGNGIDTVFGGGGNDTIRGAGGNDIIYGQAGNDTVFGGSGADTIGGNDGDDVLKGEFGHDRIIGGGGDDRVEFSGNIVSYVANRSGPNTRINDLRGSGSDLILNVEQFSFAGVMRTRNTLLNPPAVFETITVQPIVVSNSDGSNRAESFGNALQQSDIHKRIDAIFAQAAINVEFLPERTLNDSYSNIGNGGTRPGSDLSRIIVGGDREGVGSTNRNVIDMYFVETVPGFASVGENFANGLAFVGLSGVVVHVGDDLVNSSNGRAIIARVTAHEIAHNLGLRHVDGSDNLLAENGTSTRLTQDQIDAAIASPISF